MAGLLGDLRRLNDLGQHGVAEPVRWRSRCVLIIGCTGKKLPIYILTTPTP